MSTEITKQEILEQSAQDVFKQLAEDPSLAIALDPEVADHMGAFEEKAISFNDLEYDVFLSKDGEVRHEFEN